MCGLFGVHGTRITKHEKEVVKAMGRMSIMRGDDSTGMAALFKKKPTSRQYIGKWYKSVVNSLQYFDKPGAQEVLDVPRIAALIGHTRAATIGDITVEAAHPYYIHPILGAHNGTIYSFRPSEYQKTDHLSTDSEALFHKLANGQPKEILGKASRTGAFALSYVDFTSQTLFLSRNADRPLYFTHNNDHSIYFWASEKGMIEYAFWSAQYTKALDFVEPTIFEVNQLYEIPLGGGEGLIKSRIPVYGEVYNGVPRVKPGDKSTTIRDIYGEDPGFNDPLPDFGGGGGHDQPLHHLPEDEREAFRQAYVEDRRAKVKDEEGSQSADRKLNNEDRTEGLILDPDQGKYVNAMFYRHYHGMWMSENDLWELLGDGCSFCGQVCGLDDETWWFSGQDYACDSCVWDSFTLDMMQESADSDEILVFHKDYRWTLDEAEEIEAFKNGFKSKADNRC